MLWIHFACLGASGVYFRDNHWQGTIKLLHTSMYCSELRYPGDLDVDVLVCIR